MEFLGFWRGVLRAILGRRRGANGRFCRGIPGFSGDTRVQRGDSVHGGRCRELGAKKILRIFKKGAENLKIGVWKCRKGGLGTPHIGCTGRFLGAIFRPGG